MSDYLAFKNLLTEKIRKSSEKRLIDFAIDICEQQKKDYSIFSSLSGFGSPEKIEAIINKIKTGDVLSLSLIETWLVDLEQNCPDTEDFQIIEVSYALNYVSSVIDLLYFIKTKDNECVLNIAMYLLDTIDFKVSETKENDSDVGEAIQIEMNQQLNFFK